MNTWLLEYDYSNPSHWSLQHSLAIQKVFINIYVFLKENNASNKNNWIKFMP